MVMVDKTYTTGRKTTGLEMKSYIILNTIMQALYVLRSIVPFSCHYCIMQGRSCDSVYARTLAFSEGKELLKNNITCDSRKYVDIYKLDRHGNWKLCSKVRRLIWSPSGPPSWHYWRALVKDLSEYCFGAGVLSEGL